MRVLLVDDNIDAVELLAELLRRAGHDVRIATEPQEALREVPAFQPEVAIVDIGLPIMDGYELARQIRATIARCGLIALSGYAAETNPPDTRVSSFDHHLTKPVEHSALMRAVAAFA